MPEPTLTRFLRKLTTNRAARRRFRRDPHAMMKAEGLSSAHQKLLRSRHHKHLSHAVQQEQATEEPIVCVIIVDVMPGFWNLPEAAAPRGAKKARTAGRSARSRKPALAKSRKGGRA